MLKDKLNNDFTAQWGCVGWPRGHREAASELRWVRNHFSGRVAVLILYLPSNVLTVEKAMAPHSSTLAWKILWAEEPGGLQSMGSLRVGHDWETSLSLFTFLHWRRKWQPTPVFLPGESQGQGSLVGCYHGVAQSRTRLKWLSSSSAFWSFVLNNKQY